MQAFTAAIQAPVDAIAEPIEPALDAIATTIETILHALTCGRGRRSRLTVDASAWAAPFARVSP